MTFNMHAFAAGAGWFFLCSGACNVSLPAVFVHTLLFVPDCWLTCLPAVFCGEKPCCSHPHGFSRAVWWQASACVRLIEAAACECFIGDELAAFCLAQQPSPCSFSCSCNLCCFAAMHDRTAHAFAGPPLRI